jgi:hypothetical protein
MTMPLLTLMVLIVAFGAEVGWLCADADGGVSVDRSGPRRRCPRMPRGPKTTAEIIAEMTNEIIALCERLPDRHLAQMAQQMFREAAMQATKAGEHNTHQRAG